MVHCGSISYGRPDPCFAQDLYPRYRQCLCTHAPSAIQNAVFDGDDTPDALQLSTVFGNIIRLIDRQQPSDQY